MWRMLTIAVTNPILLAMLRQRRRPRANYCHKINSWAEQIRILAMTVCGVIPMSLWVPHSYITNSLKFTLERPTDRSIDLIRNAKDHVKRYE